MLIFNYQYILGNQNSSVIIAILLVLIPTFAFIQLTTANKIVNRYLYVFVVCLIFLSGVSLIFSTSYIHIEWNNITRITLVLIYLITCGKIFENQLFIWSIKLSVIIQLIVGLWQLYDPISSNYFLFGDDFSFVSFLQVSGTLGDPNYLGLILLGILARYWNDLGLFRLLVVFLILLTQSRSALLILSGLIVVKMNFSRLLLSASILVIILVLFSDVLLENSRVISLFYEENDASIEERLNSILSVTDYLENVAYHPKGAFLFPSAWKLSAPVYHYPHNTLFYIVAEYSYLALGLIGIGVLVLMRQRVNYLLVIIFAMILTLPNVHYYFPLYFFLYINEKKTLNSSSTV